MTTIIQALPGASHFDHSPLHSSSYSDLTLDASLHYPDSLDSKATYIHAEYEKIYPSSAPSSAPSSPTFTHFSRQDSYYSTPGSSLSLDNGDHLQEDDDDDDDDDMAFPSYEQCSSYTKPIYLEAPQLEIDQPPSPITSPYVEELPARPEAVNDDQAIEHEPSRHVDYLSHDWKEEDIWSSWRYIVARRKKISNSVRLENASWRTWMKAKYNLKTVSPEKLNWLKDCDVTWLYGPLQPVTKRSMLQSESQPPSRLSTSSSFVCKKPILKKKSASAAILERSRSQHSLLQRASEIIRVQQSSPAYGRPILRRGTEVTLSSYSGSSVANTPAGCDTPSTTSHRYSFGFPEAVTPADQKHVMFDQEVRQVQAIDSPDEDEKDELPEAILSESDEDDDGGLMMAPAKSRGSNRSTPRSSFSADNKTITPLPSTTLKYRTDTPEPPTQTSNQAPFWPLSDRKLSPSPSQATLRPTRPSHNFLIDDDPEVSDEPWSSSGAGYSPYDDESEPGPYMRRTASGMFMPYDENEEEAHMNSTLYGQAMYAVNTFKDIAHVVWNVGWNRK